MRTARRWMLSLAALGFAYVAYVYLTLPDVRVLAKSNPTTTAFIQLRLREARAAKAASLDLAASFFKRS